MNTRSNLSTRRSFIARTTQLTAATIAAPWVPRAADPTAKNIKRKIISHQSESYHGWPTFARLRDGRMLMSYGHRRKPYGNQARHSTDNGKTWSEPMHIPGDGTSGDLGYPARGIRGRHPAHRLV